MNFLCRILFILIAHYSLAEVTCNSFFSTVEKKIKIVSEAEGISKADKTEYIHSLLVQSMDQRGIAYKKTKIEGEDALLILPNKDGHLLNRLAYKISMLDETQLFVSYPMTDIGGGLYWENKIATSVLDVVRGHIDVATRHEVHHLLFEMLDISHPLFSVSMSGVSSKLFEGLSLASFYNNYFSFDEFITYAYELELQSYRLIKNNDKKVEEKYLENLGDSFIYLDQFLQGSISKLEELQMLLKSGKKIKISKHEDIWTVSFNGIKLDLVNTHNDLQKNIDYILKQFEIYKENFAKVDRSNLVKKDYQTLYKQAREFKNFIYRFTTSF